METSEKKYIQQCQAGDTEKFGHLYDQFVQKIYSFILHKTLHKETAEDLTSQTFLKALQKIDTFDMNKSQFNTWLFTIARNTVFDFFRTRKTETDIDDVWDLDAGQDIEKDTDLALTYQELKKSMQVLSAQEREILTLHFWQDMTYKDIAQILGKTEASVKMSASRGFGKLRKDFLLFLLFPFFLP